VQGGRNSRGNEQLRKEEKKEKKEVTEALVQCAGAISVNHRVITAPIIRYRDRSVER